MGILTEQATTPEKAEAWDRLMSSTEDNASDAVMEAYTWLKQTVRKRIRKDQDD